MKKRIAKKTVALLRRLLKEDEGAIAMEYVLIALLVGASSVAMVMVLGGHLRNMLATTNAVMAATDFDDIKDIEGKFHMVRENLKYENDLAIQAGNKLGGEFARTLHDQCDAPPGYNSDGGTSTPWYSAGNGYGGGGGGGR